jgi:hypothetical protein
MAGAGGLVSGIGSSKAASSQAAAYNDLAQGDLAAAADYGQAENIAKQNSAIEQENTAVQVYQQQRTVAKTIGTAQAQMGASNVSGGSGQYLIKSSLQQGALARSLIQTQGSIQENAFLDQAEAYDAMEQQATWGAAANQNLATAAQTQGTFALLGGIAGFAGGLGSL